MRDNLKDTYKLVSPEMELDEFIEKNKNTSEILNAIKPKLMEHFPDNEYSLELCDELKWTTEVKLLVNVHVTHEVFFNGILNHFIDIYDEIEHILKTYSAR